MTISSTSPSRSGLSVLGPQDLRGVYAIIPTPAKAGADRLRDAVDTVDLAETARVVDRLIADGVHGLMVLGNDRRVRHRHRGRNTRRSSTACWRPSRSAYPTFIGTTALGTHEVVRRTRFAAERGADGILLGLPMWQPLTIDMAVEYYRAISEAFPRLALMVYGNGRAFRFSFPPEFWRRVVEVAPTLMAAKYSRPKALLDAQTAAQGRVHFLPHDGGVRQVRRAVSRNDDGLLVDGGVDGSGAGAGADAGRCSRTTPTRCAGLPPTSPGRASRSSRSPAIPICSRPTTSSSNIFGSRPPAIARPARSGRRTTSCRSAYAEGARENARRWRELCAKYSHAFAR